MKPKISLTNLKDYLSVHLWTLVNAQDETLWADLGKFFNQVVTENQVVFDGKETHHLRVDGEHMYPYVDEGVHNGPED